MKIIAQKLIDASESTTVPTSQWVEARILMAKTYIYNEEIGPAIKILKDICFLLPPFPIEDLIFIEQVLLSKKEEGTVKDDEECCIIVK
jgi:hypothetical protein